MSVLAVTGSTGGLGGRIASRLAAAGVRQRLLVRDPARAPQLPDTEIAVASYHDTEAVRQALDGVDVALMISAAENKERLSEHYSFIEGAVAAGVRHIVYTSFAGASPEATFTLGRDHGRTEERIASTGLSYTFLRDNLYLDFFPFLMDESGVIRGPADEGRVAGVARDDVADVAAVVLRAPSEHLDKTYTLTGPEALTLTEAAAILTAGLGRPVSFHNETVEEAYASRASYGAADWQLDAWVSTYTSIAAGEVADVSPDVERISGHRATSLAELLRR
jgi:NAD(P)H dehydrogenase (quinone)